MGYLAFSELGGVPAMQASVAAHPAERAGKGLSALEWSVVAIARTDSLATLRAAGPFERAIRAVFGRPNPRLADDRLEALRRMAVLSWHGGYAVPPHAVRSFLAAGYAPDQYEAMVDAVSAARAIPQRTVLP